MKRMQEKELKKLAALTDIAFTDICKLYDMGVIDDTKAIDTLIKKDFQRISRMGKYTTKQIVYALAREYSVSRSRVTSDIYCFQRAGKVAVCDACGRVTGKVVLRRNGGLCDECVSKGILI